MGLSGHLSARPGEDNLRYHRGEPGGFTLAVFSEDSLPMRRFLYREPRIQTNLSMDFIVGDTVLLGLCLSISESGVGGTLSHSVAPGSEGVLTLYFQDQSVKVPAAIENPEAEEARIRFLAMEPAEREALRRFIKLLEPAPKG